MSSEKSKISNLDLAYKWSADDGTIFFNPKGLRTLITYLDPSFLYCYRSYEKWGELIVSLWNNHALFKKAGLKLCTRKSSLIRLFGIWLKPYNSLGLKLFTNQSTNQQSLVLQAGQSISLGLRGNTRGRPSNRSCWNWSQYHPPGIPTKFR